MAGRKPRVSRDAQAGVTPLGGPVSGAERTRRWRERKAAGASGAVDGEVTGVRASSGKGPARGYSWPPFQPGHTLSLVHGANSERAVAPRAAQFAQALLEDASVPDHVRSPVFRWQVASWARAAAVASLLYDWLCSLGPERMTQPRLAGTKSPFDQWRTAEAHESRERSKLGLDPVSYAKLARDLGLASKASEDALERMAATGREIMARRDADLQTAGGSDAG